MASANGTLAAPSQPPAPTSPSITKRKLTGNHAIVANGAIGSAQAKPANGGTHSLQAVLEDILAVAKNYDTQPSILSHPLTSSITRTPSGEADSKRTKLTPPTGSSTIASLVQEETYDSLQSFEKDVETATSDILASSGKANATATQDPLTETVLQAKVLAFRTVVKNLVDREEARRAHLLQAEADVADHEQVAKESTPVPIKEEEPQKLPSRTVLTLYGSAPPKQLFSSLQQPQKVPPSEPIPTLDTAVRVTLPLRENNLPNLISTTEVFPLPELDKKTKTTTIGEVFRAPAHLAQISPPKSARPSTSKGNSTITFAPQETPKPRRKGSQSYSHQALSAGFWLGYGGVDMPKDQTSPTAKQKSRQRALSMGEAQQPPSEAILVAVQQAKEEALFRSVYSSFAPTHDDASAIIPEETKNMLWWQKVGEKRFNETFPIDPALLDVDGNHETETNGEVDEEEAFRLAVDEFVPMEGDIFPEKKEKTDEEKDTDEVLKEISELLETLASYQRIRNLSLTTNPRTPVVQNASLATLAGSPLTPSSEEIDVYQILKSQLTLLISQLPPYAVAKLNGDQMDELNISRTILFDTKEYKGVLEEDQLSRLAKVPPVVAPTPATLARTSSGTHAQVQYPQSTQYSRPAASTHQSSSRPAYSQQQSLHRSSSMHLQRSPSGSSQPFQTNYGSTPRPGYAATPSYNQQSRPSYGTLPSGQYYPQRSAQPSSYTGATGSQFYGSTPQTQSQNRYTNPQSQNGFYPPRSQNVAPMYNGAQASQPRTASPMKAVPTPSQSAFSARPAYSTPVSGGQMRSTYYGSSQYGTPQAPATSTPFASGAANPQQMMMERQQAQAIAQSQARLAAQSSFSSRQGSGTPQPANGSYGGQNGAP
ncbi:hypothetical protein T440DRAFT_423278 [Plenodomus tracheiphilus IPT5]|uniref:Uncharacterized protein n=1 Tax=Plenodomus tracheiphilus IPT5 TaxID=1408161 RepID=A0A6A7B6P5_9PLEO|nr:hypothetical protein T440DRAFT_423278 [Plenodomus tracheiphilus IPT5]